MPESIKKTELTEVKNQLDKIPAALDILVKHGIINGMLEKPLIASQLTRIIHMVDRELEKIHA